MLQCPPNALNAGLSAVKEWRDARQDLIDKINAGEKNVEDVLIRLGNAECRLRDWSKKWQ